MALSKKEVAGVYKRSLFLQASHNYERFQSLGYLYSMVPVLKKAYADKPKEELSRAMHRHLEFFNTCPVVAQPILGVTAAMEDEKGNEAAEAISGVKVAMMGPLAGIGDSLIYMTILLICLLLAITFGSQGNPVGLLLCFLLWNGISQPLKYFGMKFGYREGTKLIGKIKSSDLISRFSFMASVVGLTMVGGLICQLVNIKLGLDVVDGGETVFSLQSIFDSILPYMLPLAVTLLCYWLMKKKKVKPIWILLGIVVAAMLGSLAGILVIPS
ncbi:MAG: PTS system mannose/fructose/sorbose family transporter subunit IID [Oscillospiraceae bacterium]|nr:PTS system mannose/fructose/sorbose family transporter subunit IID [Oscillospiraceae bacterium]